MRLKVLPTLFSEVKLLWDPRRAKVRFSNHVVLIEIDCLFELYLLSHHQSPPPILTPTNKRGLEKYIVHSAISHYVSMAMPWPWFIKQYTVKYEKESFQQCL